MSRVLAENVQLTFEVLGVELMAARGVAFAVRGAKDYERLEDGGLLARGSGTQDSAVCRHLSPAQYSETEFTSELGENCLLPLKANRVVLLEEYVTDGVLAWLGQFAPYVPLSLTLEEQVGDAGHDTSTVTISTVCTSGTPMGHSAEELTGIGDDLVRLLALDVTNEAYTTGIFLVLVLVQALTGWQRA